ncbi:TetR/AcrR family transcriptional regulator [Nocardia yamanashiensis]|uniref:TetR/AcrR family transcriptional regulator n=1 Tax=Nocardia yamanashiensis TaxID=209247 RepID=UPI001E49CDD6|nr:helix-turn-helix domain-containing protein [Nocardia yamanashiensis]UGT41545.1 TetR/AcrR family transcriptional regulator [Nocardia yamanashiensis]
MPNQRDDWLAGGNRRTVARERILAAATALFLERGIAAVGIDEIAARAGCSRATLYRHAGGKSDLVRAVIATSAVKVADRVAAEVAGLHGQDRIVEGIVASIRAIRTDPTLAQWLANVRAGGADEYLSTAPELGRIAIALTGAAPDPEAAQWIVRVVLALLAWPLPDPAAERRMVERFVAPALRSLT